MNSVLICVYTEKITGFHSNHTHLKARTIMANRICCLPFRAPQVQCLFIKSRIVPWYMNSWFRSLWAAQIIYFSHKLCTNFFPWVSNLLPQSNHFSQKLFLAVISFQILLNRTAGTFVVCVEAESSKVSCHSRSFIVKFKLLGTDYFALVKS